LVVVVDLDLPRDRSSGPVALGGLQFAEAARTRDPALRLIFIAPLTSAELSAKIEALGNATLVVQGFDFDKDLRAHAAQA
ncbi:hypothetical protein NL455_29515, partial [Klebsiella pneumoniae]|nr:hypothetical protein [Klebsiella pneumoniae]